MNPIALSAVLVALAGPAVAWDFAPTPVCTLSHEGQDMAVTVTFDPSIEEYAIHLTRDGGWPEVPVFSLRFEGPAGQTISTSRHMLNVQGPNSLTVRDRGFGNVLNGLEFNTRAVAVLGDLEVAVSLAGAAPAVAEFRACPDDQFVTGPTGSRVNQT